MLPQLAVQSLAGARRVLVAGCGGGYDVLGAVPLRHALRAAGIEVHLASLSFAYLNGLAHAVQDEHAPNLYAVGVAAATPRAYCPEAQLARFLDAQAVARSHLFLEALRTTESIWDVTARIEAARKQLPIKERSAIPI